MPNTICFCEKHKMYYFLVGLLLLATISNSCKKDKLNSKYASLLQHKWTFKSSSVRESVLGSFVGQWQTTQSTPGTSFKEFTNDGHFTLTSSGNILLSQSYQLLSDSIILYIGAYYPATPPDTSFIRQINETLFVNYSRTYYISQNYSTLKEYVDSLTR